MKHIWLDVFMSDKGLFVTDDTMYIESMESVADLGMIARAKTGYRAVVGKSITYHIRSNWMSESQGRDFAVWYHNNAGRLKMMEFTE